MARYTGALCKQCRREGEKLFLKGDRCYSGKCSIDKRGYAPGQHGQAKKKLSEYGMQLREKQKARRFYGVSEVQFRGYFEDAERMNGVTGENLLRILELRLDNAVYRLGFARSRSEARQLIRHGHFIVNGKKVNIPSYILSKNDVVEIKDASKNLETFKVITEAAGTTVPSWLSSNKEKLQGTVVALPTREEIDLAVKENSIVELYSK